MVVSIHDGLCQVGDHGRSGQVSQKGVKVIHDVAGGNVIQLLSIKYANVIQDVIHDVAVRNVIQLTSILKTMRM